MKKQLFFFTLLFVTSLALAQLIKAKGEPLEQRLANVRAAASGLIESAKGIVPGSVAGKSALDKFIEFKQLEKKHIGAWADFIKSAVDRKIDLKKKKKQDWFDFGIAKLEALKTQTIEEVFNTFLPKAIQLHEQHLAAFKKLHDTLNTERQDLEQQELKELADFKASLSFR
jgi:hypothetical protein